MPGRLGPRLRVTVTDDRGRRVPGGAALGRWLTRAAPARARGAVGVALVGDAAMRRLNARFRRLPHATDVLSFPSGTPATAAADGPGHLGDLAIAMGLARRQAREHGHAVGVELRILALHGLLHLLGYDHETDDGEMRRVEDRLRRARGLPRGLIARATGRTAGR